MALSLAEQLGRRIEPTLKEMAENKKAPAELRVEAYELIATIRKLTRQIESLKQEYMETVE